jgi:hypothetical protein
MIPPVAASIAARNRWAAAPGSADWVKYLTTTNRRAPAAARVGTVSGVTPPVTNQGRPSREVEAYST